VSTPSPARGAVFLDRDGTIIADPGYLKEPSQVALLPGAAQGLVALAGAGWPLVVVTNQSGIARGYYDEAAFRTVTRHLDTLLAAHGVRLLATYHCPHHPDVGGPCDCRKPGVKLFRDAAAAHHIALGESWFVGDRWRDVQPAQALGGRGLLIGSDPLSDDAREAARHTIRMVTGLGEAAGVIGLRR